MKNIWILTEERPKKNVLREILHKFSKDNNISVFIDTLRIIPIVKGEMFTFTYEVIGFSCSKVDKVYIKTVSGYSSFVDFLLFFQENEPTITDTPLYAIEETKTDDKESRNTGVYQRCAKFIFIENFYPSIKKIMLYNLQVSQKEDPTETYIFGTRLLLTLNIEIIGKKLDPNIFVPFKTIEELIRFKNSMRKPPKGNIPILIRKDNNAIQISGRLVKDNRLGHDPNIGALTMISAVLRKLGWKDSIEIIEHGLLQEHVTNKNNKFILLANMLNIQLRDLQIPIPEKPAKYWRYDLSGEKIGTIFIHLAVENFTHGKSIFENHAGCEKGYFYPLSGEPIPLSKYKNQALYKAGDKTQIIEIPDLILEDDQRKVMINIEGEKYINRQAGILQIATFDYIEEKYIKRYYPGFKFIRTVVLYGGTETHIVEVKVGFLLNENGEMILGIEAPLLFREAITNLLDYWK